MKWEIEDASLTINPERYHQLCAEWEPFGVTQHDSKGNGCRYSIYHFRRQVPEKESSSDTVEAIVDGTRAGTLKEVSVWLENPCVYTSHRYNCPGCVHALVDALKEGRMP